jgi:hypothetical protein
MFLPALQSGGGPPGDDGTVLAMTGPEPDPDVSAGGAMPHSRLRAAC